MNVDKARTELFTEYLEELRAAREKAVRRAAGRLQTWTRRLGSEARAHEKLDMEAPVCTDTRVVGVIRKYWLKCVMLNREDSLTAVDPREFLLGWLRTSAPDLERFLAPLPFWPVGKDEDGNWV
jgi:hypothetical protein